MPLEPLASPLLHHLAIPTRLLARTFILNLPCKEQEDAPDPAHPCGHRLGTSPGLEGEFMLTLKAISGATSNLDLCSLKLDSATKSSAGLLCGEPSILGCWCHPRGSTLGASHPPWHPHCPEVVAELQQHLQSPCCSWHPCQMKTPIQSQAILISVFHSANGLSGNSLLGWVFFSLPFF